MSAGLRKMKRSARDSSVTRSRRESASTPVMPSELRSVRAGSSSRPFGQREGQHRAHERTRVMRAPRADSFASIRS